MTTTLTCIVSSQKTAGHIVTRLKAAGFEDSEISVLFRDLCNPHDPAAKDAEGLPLGVPAEVLVPGTLGLLSGIDLLAIPDAGRFLAAGPVRASLNGIAVGGTVREIPRALVGMGVPENDARRYDRKIRAGNILVSAHAASPEYERIARSIFERHNATDIACASDAIKVAKRMSLLLPDATTWEVAIQQGQET